jgi:hypothetical protein
MTCGQCGRPAFYKYDNGAHLCVDCDLKVQQAEQIKFAQTASMLNHLADQMEMTTGLYGVVPRLEIPRPTIQMGQTVHNIKVDNSVIGSINTGQIRDLNVALDHVQNAGAPDLASALQQLTEAVLASSDLPTEEKTEAVEHLSHLAKQAALPKDQRQTAIGRTVVDGFERIINASSGLLTIWNIVKPILQGLL